MQGQDGLQVAMKIEVYVDGSREYKSMYVSGRKVGGLLFFPSIRFALNAQKRINIYIYICVLIIFTLIIYMLFIINFFKNNMP